MSKIKMKIFVYGTLKRGFYNSDFAKKCGGRYLHDDSVEEYTLIDTHGSYPYMVEHKNGLAVGEVWEFDDLNAVMPIINMEMGAGYKTIGVITVDGERCIAFEGDGMCVSDGVAVPRGITWNYAEQSGTGEVLEHLECKYDDIIISVQTDNEGNKEYFVVIDEKEYEVKDDAMAMAMVETRLRE